MIYISFRYYLFVAAMLILFYALPLKRRWCVLLAGAVILVIGIWLFLRNEGFMRQAIPGAESLRMLAPLGISFYTMQIIAYLTDVYRGDIAPQKNLAKYALSSPFFRSFYRGRFRDTGSWESSLFAGIYMTKENLPEGFI